MAGLERGGGRRGGLPRHLGPVGVEPNERACGRQIKPAGQRRLRHQRCRRGVAQHERQPLRRIAGIERQIGGAGLEDAEAARSASRASARPRAQPRSRARCLARADDAPAGLRARRARRSSAAGPRTPPRSQPACAPPARQTARAASRAEPRARCRSTPTRWWRAPKTTAPRAGRSHDPGRQPRPPADAAAAPPEPRRLRARTGRWSIPARPQARPATPSAERCSTRLSARSNFAARAGNRLHARRKPGKLRYPGRRLLERQHHLEQRMPRQRARRVQHLDQPLKRQLGMAVGRQGCRPAPDRSAAEQTADPTCRSAAPAC